MCFFLITVFFFKSYILILRSIFFYMHVQICFFFWSLFKHNPINILINIMHCNLRIPISSILVLRDILTLLYYSCKLFFSNSPLLDVLCLRSSQRWNANIWYNLCFRSFTNPYFKGILLHYFLAPHKKHSHTSHADPSLSFVSIGSYGSPHRTYPNHYYYEWLMETACWTIHFLYTYAGLIVLNSLTETNPF